MVKIGRWEINRTDIILLSIGIIGLLGLVVGLNLIFSISGGELSSGVRSGLVVGATIIFASSIGTLIIRAINRKKH